MHRGYTKRWRKRWDKKYHLDPYLWLLMDYFIDFANYRDSEVYFPRAGLIPLKRGQHIFGTPQLSAFLRIDRNLLRRKLKILESIDFLTITTTNRYSIATVINYDTYNPTDNTTNHQNNQEPTSNQPATNQQPTTPNKDNKEKNKKNIYPDWLDKKLWAEFKKHRVKIKKPMTERAEELAIGKLKKIMDRGYDQQEIIDTVILKGWQGIYPPPYEPEREEPEF